MQNQLRNLNDEYLATEETEILSADGADFRGINFDPDVKPPMESGQAGLRSKINPDVKPGLRSKINKINLD